MSRRAYLAGLGVTATALGLGAEAVDPGGQPAQPEDDFDIKRTFNVVEDLGVDPTGTDPIGPLIKKHVRSNTRLVFPEGRYRIQSPVSHFGEGIHDFSMVAPGGDATFVFDTTSPYWLSIGGKDAYNLHYEGFTHDVTTTQPAPRLQIRVRDGLVVRNVTHTGLHTGDTGPFQFGVQSPDGRGVIENLRARTGAPDDALAVGMFVGKRHTGRLEIRNCSIHGFPNNGIYQANASPGRLVVTGGTYKNNNVSNVRISGPRSVVRDVTIVINGAYAKNDRLGTNVRGIRITNGTEMTVENCDLLMGTGVPSDGAIVVESPAGSATVRNTRISLVGNDVVGIRAKRPRTTRSGKKAQTAQNQKTRKTQQTQKTRTTQKRTDGEPPSITCTGVQITGSGIDLASNGDDRAGIEISGRPGSRVERACIHLTRPGRVGVLLMDCDRSAVVDSRFGVTGEPILVVNSDEVALRGNETNVASCTRADSGDLQTATPSDETEATNGTDAPSTTDGETTGR